MSDIRGFRSFDGQEIAYQVLGAGRPTLMIHGFLADAQINWIQPGIAAEVAALGRQVILPDLRGHGRSAAPTELANWPADTLALDQMALIAHLGLSDYDLVGYSLGARTAVRLMVRGARPGKAVLGGMGDTGVMEAGDRADLFEDAIRHGEAAADPRSGRLIQAMIAQQGLKSEALLGVLASFAPTSREQIEAIKTPTLVVCGDKDFDNGSPSALAALLPNGSVEIVNGDHITAVVDPSLRSAITRFLT
eukprot:gene16884-17071_t